MAGASLLALIDDIASILDDVSTMTKVAATKTAGVLGDDLALNAQQVAGVSPDRELSVVWAVAKGAVKNKLILVPAALAISALIPWLVTPLLMAGGAFLCFEGFEKLAHKFRRGGDEEKSGHDDLLKAVVDPAVDMVANEQDKIKGAIRTDFILSAEIVAIALATVATAPFPLRVAVLFVVAFLMTVTVYGLVAGIVKLDDGGLYLNNRRGSDFWSKLARRMGASVLRVAPLLMKGLSVAGMAAMFLVGGGILAHGIPGFEELLHDWAHSGLEVPVIGSPLALALPSLLKIMAGLLAGALAVGAVEGWGFMTRTLKGRRDRSVGAADSS